MFKRLFFLISIVLVLGLLGNASASLVGYWNFNDGTANDSSGNEHHGTLTPGDETTSISIVYDANMGGNVLDVDNPADHTLNSVVDCGTGEWTDITEAITLMCWTKLENINVTEDSQYLITHGSAYQFTSNGLKDGIALFMSEVGEGFMENLLTITPIMGSWHHVAFTYDSIAQSRALYVDGIKVASDNPYGLMEVHEQGFVIGGRLTSQDFRGWDGRIDDVRLYDHALSEGEIRMMNGVYSAYDPEPGNEAEVLETLASLTWKPGPKVAATGGHKLYLGTSQALVEANDVSVYKGALDSNSYSGAPMGSLALGTTYYWRVNEVNEVNWPGDVWQFSTPPLEATEPDPLDGAKYVSVSRTRVGWTAGVTATYHSVYFGTDETLVTNGDASVYKGQFAVTSDPNWPISPALVADQKYYWRIDVNAPAVYQGNIWSFTTSTPEADPNFVGWWKLDETSQDGKNVFDASGNERYGSLENGASIVTDPLTGGDVLKLDGIDDYVNISEPEDFNFFSDFTWAAWIRTDADSGVIIARTDGEDVPGPKTLMVRYGGVLHFDVGFAGGLTGERLVNDNEWYHVAVTVEMNPPLTDDTIRLYVNGELDGEGLIDVDEPPGTDDFQLWIGFDGRAEPGEFPGFDGVISDVRIYDRVLSDLEIAIIGLKDPNQAWWPYPANKAVDVADRPLTLNWRPGVKAAATQGHRVYFGTDQALVDACDASVDYGLQDVNNLNVGELVFATTYYWRVDESNGAATWKGLDWTFTMAGYNPFEDFESYDFGMNLIGSTWKVVDWAGGVINLGQSGNNEPVNGGIQSMKYEYDNEISGWYYYSEAYRDFSSPQDWSYATGDVKSLRLYFYGETGNYPDDMYVVLNDSGKESMKLYDRDLDDLKAGKWKHWDIDLSWFTDGANNVNLASVDRICIGFGERGREGFVVTHLAGTVYFDDFRVYPPHCVPDRLKPDGDATEDCIVDYEDVDVMVSDWLDYDYTITPSNPTDANLLGYWNFDACDVTDSSGKGHHGTIVAGGEGTSISFVYDADRGGNVLEVINADVNNAVVDCGGDANDVGDPGWANLTEQVSVAAWFTLEDIHSSNQYLLTKGNTWQITSRGTSDGIRSYYEELGSLSTTRTVMDDDWHHVAITCDSTAPSIKLYLDGREVDSDEPTGGPLNVNWDSFVIGGRLNPTYIQRGWIGRIDEVRLYDDVLTEAEVVYLITGSTDPVYFDVYSPANITDVGDPQGFRFVNYKDYNVLANTWLDELLWPSGW